MNERAVAIRLSLIVAVAGLLPIAGVGAFGIELLRSRSEIAAQESLGALAQQVAGRTEGYLAQQRQLLKAIAAVAYGPDAARRLEETVLEAPSLGRVRLLGPGTSAADRPAGLTDAQAQAALAGSEVASDFFLASDTTPTMTLCSPAVGVPGHAVCAQLDLLELWRFVQNIRAGESGYVLLFDEQGRLLASGTGKARGAILSREAISSSAEAAKAITPGARPARGYVGAEGVAVVAGWSALRAPRWVVAVEQPAAEALQSARTAQWVLGAVLLIALALSVVVGVFQSARVLGALAVEERFRTAGRIAAGLTHDLGHRLRVLQQTSHLAATGDPEVLPVIRDNLAAEVSTLQKFVADFATLGRDVRALELMPLELGAFLQSVAHTASAHAQPLGVQLEVRPAAAPVWVRGDRYLLERAVLNLLSNAIEASKPGSTVSIAAVQEGLEARLDVVDRGEGIAPERLARLFDAFLTTRRTGAHLGMGLANVKRIVGAHRGRVSVKSALGAGTTFTIALAAELPPMPAP